jgi:hypothetical protein
MFDDELDQLIEVGRRFKQIRTCGWYMSVGFKWICFLEGE